ncbi:MAG: hypothetical protein AB1444_05725 [Spirochaetota bacterium]
MYILRNNWETSLAIFIITISFFSLSYSSFAFGQDKDNLWHYPNCYTVQTAGYIGFIALGVGFLSFNRTWESSLFYGYSPADVTGKVIHTVSWKNTLYPFSFDFSNDIVILPIYLGMTMLFVMDKNVYWENSTNCQPRYYNPTGRHIALNIGMQLNGRSKMIGLSHGFYVEITMLDTYLKGYLWDDNKYLRSKFDQIASLAIGYKIITNY